MEILKPDIRWNGALTPFKDFRKIDSIALHHMAHPTWTFWDVHKYHTNTNGWIGMGYNWWVAFDGTIYLGRGFNRGAGVGGQNHHILSIGFQGDYENTNKEMPKAQYDAGVWLIHYLRDLVPTIKIIDGHKHWGNTACPGRYFPLQKMIEDGWRDETEGDIMLDELIKEYGEPQVRKALVRLIKTENDDGLPAQWAENELKEAKKLGITDGSNPESFITRQEAAIMALRATKNK